MKKGKASNITKARAALILDQPFFASLLLPMPIEECNEIPTFATDGDRILYNKDFADSLTLQETFFVLAHETLHCVMDHMGRRQNRQMNRWNQAADYVINDILIKERLGTMPNGGLHNPKLVRDGGGTAEGVYKLIPEENESKGPGDSGGSLDKVFDAGSNMGKDPVDAATASQKASEMKVRVAQARNAAKMQGKMSAGLDRLIEGFLKPKVDWRSVLRRFITDRAKVDYTFARPKRRFLGEDFYLPSLSGEEMGLLTVAVDCSGSVDQTLLNKFASEINAIKEDVHPREIKVVYFDYKVLKEEVFGPEDELKLSPMGGGGTNFAPVFKYINEQIEQPIAVVFLTDLECSSFGPAPDYPVLWTVIERGWGDMKVPFGEVLEVAKEN